MSKITVRTLGALSSLTGRNEEEINIQGESIVKDVLNNLEEKIQMLNDTIVDPALESHLSNTLVLLNGVEIGNLNGFDTPVLDGDEITILCVTHGG